MLKNKTKSDDDLCKIAVAPFVGAWIETSLYQVEDRQEVVAPFVGAWIETGQWTNSTQYGVCRSFRRSVD